MADALTGVSVTATVTASTVSLAPFGFLAHQLAALVVAVGKATYISVPTIIPGAGPTMIYPKRDVGVFTLWLRPKRKVLAQGQELQRQLELQGGQT